MPIRCHAEHDGQGAVLSKIESIAHAKSLRAFFDERGILATVLSPANPKDYRVLIGGMTPQLFAKLIAGSNIELI
jgi:hypothetical protein